MSLSLLLQDFSQDISTARNEINASYGTMKTVSELESKPECLFYTRPPSSSLAGVMNTNDALFTLIGSTLIAPLFAGRTKFQKVPVITLRMSATCQPAN